MQTGEGGPRPARASGSDPGAASIGAATPDAATPNAATLVGALYQLAADPDEWSEFVRLLALPPSAADPDAETLAAVVSGAEKVAQTAAAAAIREASAHSALAVLAVAPGGRGVAGNTAAGRGPIAAFLTRPGEDVAPENRETLLAAEARLRGDHGAPKLVRLHLADEEQPLFAYALAFERLPERLRREFPAQPRGTTAIVAHSGAGGALGDDLAEAFGLTPAELRLAVAICDGASPREIARRSGLSFYTVRNQLAAVFEKVGVNRRSELIVALSEVGDIWRRLDGDGRSEPRPTVPPGFAPPPQQLRLPDGRALTYRVYGDPSGRAVLAFHGGLGASLLPPGTDAAAKRLGLHIIAPERAGIGRSHASDGMGAPAAAAGDMAAVIAELGLSQPQFVSVTSGAHAALATAAAAPGVASRILMISPRPPMDTDGPPTRSPMVAMQRRLRAHPWLAEAAFAIARLRMSKAILRQIMLASAVAPGDAAWLAAHPETFDLIHLGLQEAMARTVRGTAIEIAATPARLLADLPGPLPTITVFHGAEDAYASPAEVQAWLGGAVSELTVFEGIGNYTALKHWPDALDWLAASNQG
ncbi:MAG: hypothetical protein JSS35_10230 [Proteobacteria bacterium]|nr:hypothetical protein [Pseudomonadota bacterium]